MDALASSWRRDSQGFPSPRSNLRAALWDARWELPLPFVVLGGVFGGVFAISEAAAVTAAYVILAEVVLYKEVAWRQLSKVAVESMVMVGGILLILGIAFGVYEFSGGCRGTATTAGLYQPVH